MEYKFPAPMIGHQRYYSLTCVAYLLSWLYGYLLECSYLHDWREGACKVHLTLQFGISLILY